MLRREAARWLARLQSGSDPDTERRFRQWHDAHQDHAEAFARVRRSYEAAGLLRFSDPSSASAPRVGGSDLRQYALAACLGALILIPVTMLVVGGRWSGPTNAVMLATRVGEIREERLDDRSAVTLDTDTVLKVTREKGEHVAKLVRGRARFTVAPGAEPVAVRSGDTVVTISNGTVDVERSLESRTGYVAVLSGEARVTGRPGQTPTVIRAGQTIDGTRGGHIRKALDAGNWPDGMLKFDGTALGTAAALANRYSDRDIHLAPELRGLRVSGAFRAGDTASFARALAAMFDLTIERTNQGDLHLSPRGSTPRQKQKGG